MSATWSARYAVRVRRRTVVEVWLLTASSWVAAVAEVMAADKSPERTVVSARQLWVVESVSE